MQGGVLWRRMTANRAAFQPQCSTQADLAPAKTATRAAMRSSWKVVQPGRVANLQLHHDPMPQLQPGQALVKVRAIGLNFADVFCCLGLYAAAPKATYIPGLEFAGDVVEVCEDRPAGQSDNGTSTCTSTSSTNSSSNNSSSGGSRSAGGSGRMSSSEQGLGSHPSNDSSTAPATNHTLPPGTRVMGVTRFGAYSSHVVLDTRYLRPIPDAWSYAQAAAYPVQSITAMYALSELGALRPGAVVLVQSAAGGVGLQALQIAQRMGAGAVLGLVGSREKVQFLRSMFAGPGDAAGTSSVSMNGDGADSSTALGNAGDAPGKGDGTRSSNSRSTNSGSGSSSGKDSRSRGGNPVMEFAVRPDSASGLAQLLRSFLGRHHLQGFDCVLDSVLGDAFQPCFEALAPCGRYVVFGAAALTPSPVVDLTRSWSLLWPTNWVAAAQLLWAWSRRPRVDVASLPGTNRSVCGFNLIWIYERQALMAKLFGDLLALELPPPHMGHVFAFQDMVAALELLQSGRTVGKVVVEVDADAVGGFQTWDSPQ